MFQAGIVMCLHSNCLMISIGDSEVSLKVKLQVKVYSLLYRALSCFN